MTDIDDEIREILAEIKAGRLTGFVERNDCDHDWQGWRDFDDGHGGERVCAKCGMGAMHHSLMFCDF